MVSQDIKLIKNGSITSPEGFLANGIHCGIKKSGKKDLCLIYSVPFAAAAGVFTTNKVKAAPVRITEKLIKKGKAKAVIVNSGNANACTGKSGFQDALEIINTAAKYLNVKPSEILAASTGRIGIKLPVDKIKTGIKKLVSVISENGGHNSASAILTTDRYRKEIAIEFKIDNKTVRLGGMVKGAGMISPRMATMLCFLTTDISIEHTLLKSILKEAADNSFNLITIDGDCSTNDTVIILANGSAGNKEIKKGSKDYKLFLSAVNYVCSYLAFQIVKNGEGVTKIVRITVSGAKTGNDARKVVFSVADSKLVKTSLYGADPNWGRIMAAIGYSGADVTENKIDIFYGGYKLVERGEMKKGSYSSIKKALSKKEVELKIDLNRGAEQVSVLTCDLSPEYVKINAEKS